MHYIQNLIQSLDFSSVGTMALRVVSVLLCLVIHETSHGAVAYALGDPTAKRMHRLSLNPLRHIDWVGMAMMLLVGFGWAKPVPVDMRYFKKPKQGMALCALAGPVSNFLLAILLLLCGRLVYETAAYTPFWDGCFNFLLSTAALSIGLGVFNLLPIPPLDGSKVLGALLPDSAYATLMRYERYGMLLLIVLSFTNFGGNLISGAIYGLYDLLVGLIF
ncbi:MAG: site-2 protease family protein [Oscillospiraceae bacterium]